jgi:DNA primase
MTIEKAKDIDMVDYLALLGHHPTRVSRPHYWYKSPFHDERTPSFKVNRQLNKWYDFSEGKGGNLVDFGVLYHGCSVKDLLEKLDRPGISLTPHQIKPNAGSEQQQDKNKISILTVKPIVSLPLIKYLRDRRIPDAIAAQYLKEVNYELKGKKYYALGFKNDSGGYELRNEYVKNSSSPKDSTLIDNGAKDLAVFEGFFNFLSYRTMFDKQDASARNFLILNSTAFFEKNLSRMQDHQHVHLYLDNDKTGQKCTLQALALGKEKFTDERGLYQNYGDLNDWLMHIGQSQRQRLQQRP